MYFNPDQPETVKPHVTPLKYDETSSKKSHDFDYLFGIF